MFTYETLVQLTFNILETKYNIKELSNADFMKLFADIYLELKSVNHNLSRENKNYLG